MRTRYAELLMAVAVGWLLTPAARAVPLTLAMEGTVTSVTDPLGMLDFAHVNDRAVYTFTVDSDAPDLNPHSLGGFYDGVFAQFSLQNTPMLQGVSTIEISQAYAFRVTTRTTWAGYPAYLYFELIGTAVPDCSLASLPYTDLSRFESKYFQLVIHGPPAPPRDPTDLYVVGSVDEFYRIPEPSVILSICVGLACRRSILGRTKPRHTDVPCG